MLEIDCIEKQIVCPYDNHIIHIKRLIILKINIAYEDIKSMKWTNWELMVTWLLKNQYVQEHGSHYEI